MSSANSKLALELRHIEYVEAVAAYANFTRAATALHVAQPALSAAVRRIEAGLGVRLFERTSRRVMLTHAGQAFLARAHRITAEVDQLNSDMSEFAAAERGRLRLSAWHHLDPRMLTLLREYSASNPGVDVAIAEMSAAEALDALRRDELDIAAIGLCPTADLTGVEYTTVRSEPLVLVTPADHRLARRPAVDPAELTEERFILPLREAVVRRGFERVFAEQDQPPRVVLETHDFAAMMSFVSAGLGVAIAPPSITRQGGLGISTVPLRGAPTFTLAAAWRKGPHQAIARRAIDSLRPNRRLSDPEGMPRQQV
jgi:DNA-binding transcriptional LysR family regulator